MKKQTTGRNLSKLIFQTTSLLLVVGVVAIFGLQQLKPSHAATSTTATLSTSPASGTYQVGNTISVAIYENSGTEPVGTVQADLTYNSTILAYANVDNTGSQFTDIAPPPTAGTGVLSISRGGFTAQTGNQKVVTVNFTVLKTGTASVAFAATSAVYRDSDLSNIYSGGTGSSFTISTPVITPPVKPPVTTPPVTTPPVTTPVTTAPTTTTKAPTTTAAKSTTTSYVRTGTTTPVTVAASTPLVTSQTFTAAPVNTQVTTSDGTVVNVTQVQYLLNDKVVATVKTAPFSYTVQTKQLRNGIYTLTTKTTYSDGHVATASQKLNVDNPYGLTQLSLDAKHYAWATVPFTVIAFAAIGLAVYVLLRPRNSRIHSYGQVADPDLTMNVPGPNITQTPSSLSPQDGEKIISPTEPQKPDDLNDLR
jgi:hypothetical protein